MLGVLTIVFFFLLRPAAVAAGSKFNIDLLTADVSIVAVDQINASFTFDINTQGRLFREFKLSNEGSFYKWSKTSMQCVTDSGKKYGMERMPRADGLTAMKVVSKRSIKSKSISCSLSGTIDPIQVEYILSKRQSGDYFLSLPLPAVSSRIGELMVTIHFPDYISEEEIALDDMTAEEFLSELFPSALTLHATSIPAHHLKTIEVLIASSALETLPDFYGSKEPSEDKISSFVGMKRRGESNLNFSLIVFLSSLFMFLLILLRSHLSGSGQTGPDKDPYLIFSSIGGLTRALISLCLIMLFAVFTLSGVFLEAMVFMTCSVVMQLRAPSRKKEPVPDPSPQEPAEEKEEDAPEAAEDAPEAASEASTSWSRLFILRRIWGILFLFLFLAAGAVSSFLVLKTSLQAAQNLAAAFVVCSCYLFFSPETLWRSPLG